MTSARPTIHVVDDDALFRRAIGRLLRTSGYDVASYETPYLLLERLPGVEPGCILLDVRMPELSGPEVQARLSELGNVLPIVFLTGHGDIPMSVRAIKTGAEDFLLKPVPKKVLLEAIKRALARYEVGRQQRESLDGLRTIVATLTPREREVLGLLVRGKLHKTIAFEIGTTQRTIKAHRHNIMRKLRVQTFAEAVLIAERLGIVTSSATGSE